MVGPILARAGHTTRSSLQYRGWNGVAADHNYNWHDSIHDSIGNPCGNDSPVPCDDIGHGTHTIGTAIGDDGVSNQIGMAPSAKWIGCRNMDQGNGTPARYLKYMESFLCALSDRRRPGRPIENSGYYEQLMALPGIGRLFG